ncbi:hypothetical protein PHYBLDRAFT_172385 [Phycomyces blakesleeanus NRRL 1555(-)]|uniref:Uncharacterized protein n=1 Tax=Phycomyces blakesleeanus (strain ATCC 8743b / DSM 1359 / FGSC 10004 / NBRC 33097 / NRRL 1555) TaxID=763407 RepID=A0A162TJQ2_PHYB8|nr:hypothetical protein PHYBLDRAFT_172385 [Phycomyces blakesleeanus NRRL 1555(-)]OAD69132.1 hypothetical protein PHYBLDRAFT_172385 [Phycomyces blakesleeanus NRRL 1555(-)]|eukprot:XP_018287172.1 hypothetical protein PHYBLDRAFT_172385 [Phycomyces blakesleeanus NRRL 1555(-)]
MTNVNNKELVLPPTRATLRDSYNSWSWLKLSLFTLYVLEINDVLWTPLLIRVLMHLKPGECERMDNPKRYSKEYCCGIANSSVFKDGGTLHIPEFKLTKSTQSQILKQIEVRVSPFVNNSLGFKIIIIWLLAYKFNSCGYKVLERAT